MENEKDKEKREKEKKKVQGQEEGRHEKRTARQIKERGK